MLNANNSKLVELKQQNIKLQNQSEKLKLEVNSLKRMMNSKAQAYDNIEDHIKRE